MAGSLSPSKLFSCFTRDTDKTPQSIYGKEYITFPDHRPDQISRWYGKRKVEGGSREARNKVVDIFWNWGILVFGGTQEIIQLSGRRCQVSFSKLCGLLVVVSVSVTFPNKEKSQAPNKDSRTTPQIKRNCEKIPPGVSPSQATRLLLHFPLLMGNPPSHFGTGNTLRGTWRCGSWESCLMSVPTPLVFLWHCDLTYLWDHHLKYWVQLAFPDHSRHRPPCLLQTRGQAWKSTLSPLVNQCSSPGFPSGPKRIFLGKALNQADIPEKGEHGFLLPVNYSSPKKSLP
nr:uncharacterized protein C1orf158 homolog [Macaca nemestrina]